MNGLHRGHAKHIPEFARGVDAIFDSL
jgi:hypothetical protein